MATELLTPNRRTPEQGALERRFAHLEQVELRGDDDKPEFFGHAAVFNQEVDFVWWREMIAPGAFAKTITEADVRFVFNHNPDSVMARTKPGGKTPTLRLSEDSVGLFTEADLNPADLDVQRLVPKLRDGNVTQMSFAFRVVKEEWDETDPKSPLRVIREVKLYDVSPVTFPAYEGTDAQLRAAFESFQRNHDPEADVDSAIALLSSLPAAKRALTDDEAAEAREAVAVLRRLLSGEPVSEPQEEHSEEGHSLDADRALRAIAVRRRRLRVA